MTARLRIEEVSWSAGARSVLSNITLDLHGGEFVAIMGKNGAGKSTLLDIAACLRQPATGTVWLNERALQQWDHGARARLVAHLPQAVRPDLPFLAGELVLMGRYPHTDRWFESDEDRAAVERAMHRTGCWDLRHRAVHTLSGGERQRVLLAACFAQAPAVLLFDEPSTYLDIDQQLHCFSLLREACVGGAASVAVTHDLNLALAYATRIVVLEAGRIALDMRVEDAVTTPNWLRLFSTRLTIATTPSGRPRVYYS